MNIIHTTDGKDYAQKGIEIIEKSLARFSDTECHFALAGGSSFIPVYQSLARADLNWPNIHFWWSDERMVPHDHPDSNFKQFEPFLKSIPVPATNIHSVPTSLDPAEAVKSYSTEIFAHLGSLPKFDLVLLGLGPDGHLASLFPATSAGQDQISEYLIPIFDSPKPPPNRITFTFKLINLAKNVLVAAQGPTRVAMIQSWLNGQPSNLPFTHLSPIDGNLYWLMHGKGYNQGYDHSLSRPSR